MPSGVPDRRLVSTGLAAAIALLAVAAGIGTMGTASSAESLGGGSADPATVNETAKVEHTFGYLVENVSKDGNTDRLFLVFPDGVNESDGDLSSFGGNATNAETGASVSISSSAEIVDGPDGDGIKETVTVAVQPEGEQASVDLIVNFTGAVTWPAVDADTGFPVEGAVTDSKYADIAPTTAVMMTVRDTDVSSTPTPTPTETATSTPAATATSTPTETATEEPTATDTLTPTDTRTMTPTDAVAPTESPTPADRTRTGTRSPTATPTASPTPVGTTGSPTERVRTRTDEPTATGTATPGQPGFGVAVALAAVLAAVALAARRRRQG